MTYRPQRDRSPSLTLTDKEQIDMAIRAMRRRNWNLLKAQLEPVGIVLGGTVVVLAVAGFVAWVVVEGMR